MIAKAGERWQAVLDHPILQLELRRIRRKRWWPGRRFFLFYPVLLGGALGYSVILALNDSAQVRLAALVTGVPVVCLLSVVTSLLTFALPWIAPALTATTIARERELGTLDLLRSTLLTERSIVLGKLGGCLARLWPGIFTLALLTPVQMVWVTGSGLLGMFSSVVMDAGFETWLSWVWLLLTGVAGLLRPWSDLALHAAIGLFVSVLSRSSGAAIAVSYGTILVIRAAFWLGQTLLFDLAATLPTLLEHVLLIPALASLGIVLVEVVGAASLVWAAVWWLKRA